MTRTTVYWVSTAIAAIALPGALTYLTGLPILREWAYAGATFAWMMAFISASASGEPVSVRILPLILLGLLMISYATRPLHRRMVRAA